MYRLFVEGDRAREDVFPICDESGFISHVKGIADAYEVSEVAKKDHVVVYRNFKPAASFGKLFSPKWRKDHQPDVDGLLHALAVALEAFHARGIAHGNLQPEYVVVDTEGGVHLCAVGFSDFRNVSATVCAANDKGDIYSSPEVLSMEGCDRQKGDVYSFGSIVYYALTGEHAFFSKNVLQVFKMMTDGVKVPESVPAKYKRLIEWCWQPVGQRPTMGEVVEYLS